MSREGERIRNVEGRERANMIEVSADPTGVIDAAAGTLAIQSGGSSPTGALYYNSNGTPGGWISLGGGVPVAQGGEWSRETDVPLTHNVPYTIVWETEIRDTGGYWPGSGTDITIQEAGVYSLVGSVAVAMTLLNESLILDVFRDSTAVGRYRSVGGNFNTRVQAVATVYCDVGDIITLRCEQESGVTVNLTSANIHVYKVGS